MGVALDEGGDEGVAGGAAGAAGADVVGRFGRHAGEHHGREVADVDAHFEGGGGGDDVGGIGGVAGLECGFEVFAFGSAEHAGVFAGDGTAGPAGAVEAAVVVIVLGGSSSKWPGQR